MPLAPIPAPRTLPDVGVRQNVLEDVLLKMLYSLGEGSLLDVAEKVKLNVSVVEVLFQRLRKHQICEVTGLSGGFPTISLTTQGKSRALELLRNSRYVGPAPVSLAEYVKRINGQSVRDQKVRPEAVMHAFRHLVLHNDVLKQLGTAAISGRAIFLYGPPGTGKTSVAESFSAVYHEQSVWIPYAVEVDGQIITIYDPPVHGTGVIPEDSSWDRRWVLCRRPRVLVGGELAIEMLDLQLNPLERYYTAPVQMKANNGLLIIDDFGRQRIRPEELLNRWVVPLDRKIDFLTLAGGRKIEVPFDVFVVFATNLDPATLVDEAFLRRIQSKVKLDCTGPDQFHEIFRRICESFDLTYQRHVVDKIIEMIQDEYRQPLRPCHPRDLAQHIRWAAEYSGIKAELSDTTAAEACRIYFV